MAAVRLELAAHAGANHRTNTYRPTLLAKTPISKIPHAVDAVLLEPAVHAGANPAPTPTSPTPLIKSISSEKPVTKTPLAETPHAVAAVPPEPAAHAGIPLVPTPLAQMHQVVYKIDKSLSKGVPHAAPPDDLGRVQAAAAVPSEPAAHAEMPPAPSPHLPPLHQAQTAN